MTVYDPQTYRTLVARPGEVAYKFYSVNKLMQDMAAAGLVALVAAVDAPADTSMLWLDLNAPEAEGGVTKAYSGGAWVVLTRSLFFAHIGALGGALVTLTGDVTGSGASPVATTLATVNGTTGAFGSSSAVATFTVNGKGLITAAGSTAIAIPATALTGLGTGVATWLSTPTSANLSAAITDETGSGSLVFANTPTLIAPLLGTPTSGVATNLTGLPIATGVSGLAAGVAAFLGTPSSANLITAVTDETGTGALVFATSPTLVTPILGTPASGTLTNATGLPISTGVSGLAAGVAAFLATPSSANLITAVTDETGTGALVFATSPTFVTPALGTPASGVATNLTGTAAGLTAGNVTTNANLTGVITSIGNTTSIFSQTGTGTKFVVDASPTLTGVPLTTTAANGTNTTQIASTAYVLATKLNQFAAPTSAVALNAQQITGLADPALAQDAATKAYVDLVAQGFSQKPTARLATTAALAANTYANGTAGVGATLTASAVGILTVDAINVVLNDIILVKNEAAGANNGLYKCTTAGTAGVAYVLTRQVNMDSSAEFYGAFIPVDSEGTTNSNSLWLNTNTTAPTVGTTAITFVQLNKGTDLSAGANITITGNSVAVQTSPSFTTPLLGTPTSGTLTNCTGLPISTGVSGLAAGAATFLATPTSANLITLMTDETGTGANVFANTPTLIAPLLGTPTSGVATNLTGLPISTGVSGLAAGVATFLGTPTSANLIAAVTDETGTGALVFATSPTLVTPVLGTPTSGTLTNATGLPISTGVSGLAVGVATFLATPSSANLIAAVTDETGTGALVFATSPTLVTPVLGTPTSGTLTNATGLPISTGVSGLAAGAAAFLATPTSANLITLMTDETGTGANVFATSPTLVTPVLGTPTSGTLTSCTGLPISTGVSGLAAGVATFLGTPTSANLIAAVTDETGTGALVFATSPTLVTPVLGTPTSATLTNATGLPLATGVTGTLPIANGGTAQATAILARGSTGLAVENYTGTGDTAYTILATDQTVGTSAAFTAPRIWTLPAANTVNKGQQLFLADFAGGVTATNTLTISRAGADTINGGTSVIINAGNGAFILVSDGVSKWSSQAIGSSAVSGVSSFGGSTGAIGVGYGLIMTGATVSNTAYGLSFHAACGGL